MLRASIYCRISQDHAGQELGVERQEQECREFCERQGWAVGEVYVDNDLSATTGVVRPAFERLLTSKPQVIVCWHSDRFVRLSSELERVIGLGVNVHAVHAGHLDLSTPAGRAVAKTLTAWAQYEGEQKALRQKAANRQRASLGKPSWASRPPLGYSAEAEAVPEEAEAIRRAYEEILDGRSLYAIAQSWNAEGPQPRREGRWTGANLRRLLLAPRNAGISTYHGEEVGPGNWEAIVDEEVFRAVEVILTTDGRFRNNRTNPGGRKSSSMLAGIAVCGVCGANARTQRHNTAQRFDTYVCGGTGHFSAPLEQVDSLVLWRVVDALNEEDVQRYWRDRGGDDAERTQWMAEAAVLRGRQDEAAQAFASGVITMQQLATINGSLQTELAGVEGRLAAWKPAYQTSVLLADVEAIWERIDDMALPDLRQLVQEVCEAIVIKPRENRRAAFGQRHLEVSVRGSRRSRLLDSQQKADVPNDERQTARQQEEV